MPVNDLTLDPTPHQQVGCYGWARTGMSSPTNATHSSSTMLSSRNALDWERVTALLMAPMPSPMIWGDTCSDDQN